MATKGNAQAKAMADFGQTASSGKSREADVRCVLAGHEGKRPLVVVKKFGIS